MQPTFQIDVTASGTLERETPGGQLSYDALAPKGRRKSAPSNIVREDVHVKTGRRRRLQANARDIAKNFTIAAWMIRRHLDYVASFAFQARTGDRELDRELELLMEIQSRPLACDRGGRFGREKLFRQLESARCQDGDMGMLRLRSGHVQLLESDLIQDPPDRDRGREERLYWSDGVQVDYAGRPYSYATYGRKRSGQGYEYRRRIPAQNFHLYGFFERSAADQTRGISPVVASLNNFRDVYENIDFAQVKAKISQLFALAMMRKTGSEGLNKALPTEAEDAVTNGEACEEDLAQPREIDLSGGPTVFELDEDEDVKLIESNTPATEFQAFMEVVIAVALKSLDIPYSFYNERFTNYSGSRTAWLHYERACGDKRSDQAEARRIWTLWTLQRWVADGIWSPPSGKSIADIRFDWVPRGMPWWKPSEEIVGDLKAMAGGLDNIDRVCRERDRGDPRDNVDANLEFIKYAHEQAEKVLGTELAKTFALNWSASFAPEAPGSSDAGA